MDTLFSYMDLIGPTFFSVLSVGLLRKKTRWLCYATVLLSIGAELIPLSINALGLTACITCLVALMVGDFLRTHYVVNPMLRIRMLGFRRLLG
jgi:hypothetical protein